MNRDFTPILSISASDAREIFHITHDGQLVVNPEFTIDEAAAAFWDAVQQLARASGFVSIALRPPPDCCSHCGAVSYGNLSCPTCRQHMRVAIGPSEFLDRLDEANPPTLAPVDPEEIRAFLKRLEGL